MLFGYSCPHATSQNVPRYGECDPSLYHLAGDQYFAATASVAARRVQSPTSRDPAEAGNLG